jgi:type IV secretion system protein VirB10
MTFAATFAAVLLAVTGSVIGLAAQETPTPAPVPSAGQQPRSYRLQTGTKIPLSMLNSVSTKNSVEGDRIYLETIFPIIVDGKIVIPPGSSVAGTVTSIKRAGRVKGKSELYVRFDTLILPNGTQRDFRARMGSLDGRANETLDREEGKIKGDSNIGGDLKTIGTAASVGVAAGSIAGRSLGSAGIGGAAGAAAGLVGVLLTRGPDAVLARGTTLDMVLDREITFEESELNFSGNVPARLSREDSGPLPSRRSTITGPRVPGTIY